MNRHDEIERIVRLVHDNADVHVLRECTGRALDLAYQEGYRQCKKDQKDASNAR